MSHYTLSMIKSALRIIGALVSYIVLFVNLKVSVGILAISFSVAEILGILEEIFDKRKE